MSTMKHALERAGLSERDTKLNIALAAFRNNGGSYQQALGLLNAAYYGQPTDLRPGIAVTPRETARNGLKIAADSHDTCANAGAPKDGERGHLSFAEHGHEGSAPSPSPNPGHARRGLSAIRAAQPALARSLFDSVRLPDGRSLRQVQWHELPKLAGEYRKLSRVLLSLHGRCQPTDPFATVDKVATETELQDALAQAEKHNDIA